MGSNRSVVERIRTQNLTNNFVNNLQLKTVNNQSIIGPGDINISPVIPDQMIYIQETEPVVAVGKSALWIVPLPNGSFTMNIIQN